MSAVWEPWSHDSLNKVPEGESFTAIAKHGKCFSSNNRSRYGIVVRGLHVLGSCIIHGPKEVGKRGLKMTLVFRRGLSPPPLHHSGRHNVHILSREYNVIATTCRVCTVHPWSEWPSVPTLRLRRANLKPPLRAGSRAYDPPNPVIESFWRPSGGSWHHPLAVLNGAALHGWQAQSHKHQLIF